MKCCAKNGNFKKSYQHLFSGGPVTREMRYQFIREHQGQFRLTILLRILGVCASAFYGWQKRPVSQRAQQKELLVARIRELFEQSKGRYGSPRIHRDLQDLGMKCSQKRVARLMREQNLVVRKARKFVATTDSAHAFPVAQNLLTGATGTPPIMWTVEKEKLKIGGQVGASKALGK